VSPNKITQSLVALLAGMQVPFLCVETHELGEEIVASYLYQVFLYHWLETNDYGRFLVDDDLLAARAIWRAECAVPAACAQPIPRVQLGRESSSEKAWAARTCRRTPCPLRAAGSPLLRHNARCSSSLYRT